MGKRRPSNEAITVNFDAVLEDHLPEVGIDFEDAMLAIALTASDRGKNREFLLNDEWRSANQIVSALKLEPFVDVVRDCNDWASRKKGGFSPGEFVTHETGGLFRILMCRGVTQFAMPRTDNCEVLLETMSGEYWGFAAENELTNLSKMTADALSKFLAKMVKTEEISIKDALACYLETHHLKTCVSLTVALAQAAIAEAILDHFDAVVDLPKKGTVAQAVEALNLKPFLSVKRKKGKK